MCRGYLLRSTAAPIRAESKSRKTFSKGLEAQLLDHLIEDLLLLNSDSNGFYIYNYIYYCDFIGFLTMIIFFYDYDYDYHSYIYLLSDVMLRSW